MKMVNLGLSSCALSLMLSGSAGFCGDAPCDPWPHLGLKKHALDSNDIETCAATVAEEAEQDLDQYCTENRTVDWESPWEWFCNYHNLTCADSEPCQSKLVLVNECLWYTDRHHARIHEECCQCRSGPLVRALIAFVIAWVLLVICAIFLGRCCCHRRGAQGSHTRTPAAAVSA